MSDSQTYIFSNFDRKIDNPHDVVETTPELMLSIRSGVKLLQMNYSVKWFLHGVDDALALAHARACVHAWQLAIM